ncbi:deoxyhypusine synthase family protein [Candidatus Woesearchaeota archaeon]|nr:deoxyhypusine synthase family protein [Candidatus Woesearchaeota archaeon]
MELFDRRKIKVLPISAKDSKTRIEDVIINPDSPATRTENYETVKKIADQIIKARKNNRAVIISFGAHLIKNGLALVLRRMIQENYVSHLVTNGAGSIHDWEFAFHGETEEDVEKYIAIGQFGIWDEIGKYINLALISGARHGKGYGESIGEMIHNELLILDNERIKIPHPFKRYSVQEAAFVKKIPFTVHPGYGYDIIYSHPACDGASIGKTSEVDFLSFVNSVSNLEGGVYISIGSAIMSPMIFEKSLSMARNAAHQEGKKIKDFMIVVNDIKGSDWDFSSKKEPPKNNPAYYERFCKSFKRMGARELHYIREDNRNFLLNLYTALKEDLKA